MTMISIFPLIFIGDVSGGANASNNPLCITIEPKVAQSECWAAVLAQERYEWGFKWKCLIFPALFLNKHIELMGHAVETYIAWAYYHRDIDDYEKGEALSLGWYSFFQGTTIQEKIAMLRKKRGPAKRWVERHHRFVEWAIRQEPRTPA